MSDRRCALATMKLARAVEQFLVGEGRAAVLAQMLDPAIDDEVLAVALGISRVEEQTPEIRAVAPAQNAHRVHDDAELGYARGVDAVLDGDHDRSRFGADSRV